MKTRTKASNGRQRRKSSVTSDLVTKKDAKGGAIIAVLISRQQSKVSGAN